MRLVMITAAALALTACASGATAPAPASFDASATQWTGWIRFVGHEFALYDDENALRRPFSQDCVSGVLPLDLQRQAARDLGGLEVVVTGRTAAWSDDLPGDRLEHEGSILRNECRKGVVILASSVRPN